MEMRPHRLMKLRGDPREIASRVLARFGYVRTARRHVLFYLGWCLFVLGGGLPILGLLSHGLTESSIKQTLGGAVAGCALGLVLVSLGRRRYWFLAPDGGLLRLDGVRKFVITEEASGQTIGEWSLPKPPGEDQSGSLPPQAFARMVRELADLVTPRAEDSPWTRLAEVNTGVLRSWILFGELASRLKREDSEAWERGERLPRWIPMALSVAILVGVALTYLDFERFGRYASGSALLTIAGFATQKAWGHSLRYGRLRLTDRFENGIWTINLRGPTATIEESLPTGDLVDEHLALVDPAPIDELAARANALLD